jgi:hypothetical protein
MSGLQRHSRRRILLAGMAGLLVIVLGIGLGWLLGWFGPAGQPLQAGSPGAATGSGNEFRIAETAAGLLQQRMLKLLENGGSLASWYRLAGKFGQPDAVRSAEYLAADQLRYGWFLLEQGDRKIFQNWWLRFRAMYLTETGVIRPDKGSANLAAGDFWRTNLAGARLLLQSCSRWPDRQRRADLQQLSAQLLELAASGLAVEYLAGMPTPGPTFNPAATPTPKPSVSPAAIAAPQIAVLRLATLDVFAMQQLVQVDPRWQDLAAKYLAIVKAGYLGDALPLYALAYDASRQGYLPYSGDSPSVDTAEAMLVMLHLSEIGQLNGHSLSWLREQLYNQHALYESYHITQNQPTSSQECLPAYAMAARIARIQGDQDLYAAAVERLVWHQATNQRSAALDAIYREDAAGLILVTAADNTWALLALR